jgi:RNA polymerase sigma-32 factor
MQKRLEFSDVSLNAPAGNREDGERLNFLHATARSAEERYGKCQLKELLRKRLRKFKQHLDKRETVILKRRVLASHPDTLQALGKLYRVSRERIRQVEAEVIGRLRDFWLNEHADIRQYFQS